MQNSIRLLFVGLFILAACGKPGEQKGHEDHDEATDGDNPNRALYDQVMDIHNEVMPKMEDLEKYKIELQDRIAKTPGMAADKKEAILKTIAALDSAGHAMMDWMHNFDPLPDSVDQEKARAYLESEMERIKKVREVTLEVIEKAKEEVGKE